MKELTIEHLTLIAGGFDACGFIEGPATFGASIKGGQEAGKIFALQAGWGEGAIATKTARLGGFVGMAGSIGYIGGSCLYKHNDTVRETAIGMMESLHLRYGDQSGNDYGNQDGNAYGD